MTDITASWHLVNDWRNDDSQVPLPQTEFALDLVHAIDDLLIASKWACRHD